LFAAGASFAQAPGDAPQSGAQQNPAPAASAPERNLHSVTVTFDYDFTLTPACTPKIHERCVARFVTYDISAGYKRRAKLFVIPVPDGAVGRMHAITFTSPKLDFESGKHQLAVAAQEPGGIESRNYAATVWVVIP
jgi:hypothetical protein